jgi:hypothetical protein
MSNEKPDVIELWKHANGDGTEYRRLMFKYGYLIPMQPGKTAEPLPCGEIGPRIVRFEVDPSVCVNDHQIYAPLDGREYGPGDKAILFEPKEKLEWDAAVASIDFAYARVYFDVHWDSIRSVA